jgi:hypothetical protein
MARMKSTYSSVRGLNRALAKLPKLATVELREASLDIANAVASDARRAAMRVGGVARHVAPTIKASRDRVPAVKMGGSGKLPSTNRSRAGGRQTVGDVIWGAEFGGRGRPTTQQFQPHRGTRGYFLWPTVRERSDDTQERYSEALDTALGKM